MSKSKSDKPDAQEAEAPEVQESDRGPKTPLGFRCKNCGHLHHTEHAGELELPAACRVCNHGVKFHPRTGLKELEPENWEVLADASAERLEELGLKKKQVGRHEGKGKSLPEGKSVRADVREAAKSKDK